MEYVGAKPLRFWLCALAVGGMAIGAFGPWATVVFASRNGLDYGDGWVVIICAVAAGAGLARYGVGRMKGLAGVLLGGGIGFASCAYDWHQIDQSTVGVGWGIQLATVASAVVVIDGLVLAVRTPQQQGIIVPNEAVARRECPHCRELMRRDAGTCPHCRKESTAWIFHDDAWWLQSNRAWLRYDEQTRDWIRWEPSADGETIVETTTEAASRCPRCGTPIYAREQECPSCGTAIAVSDT